MAAPTDAGPAEFRRAVDRLDEARIRAEIEIGPLPAPARLAPWSHAISVTLHERTLHERTLHEGGRDPATDAEAASGRMILLYDPEGVSAWGGNLRIVVFATCELERDIAVDPLLPDVAWSWLTEALEGSGASFDALGGTVTATSSTRFGDIAGPHRTDDLELRASWTASGNTALHLQAFAGFLASAAGLPPEGVTLLQRADP
jgi:hypothetical protein